MMTKDVSVAGAFRDVTGKPFNDDRAAVRLLNDMMDAEKHLIVSIPISRLNATQSKVNDDFREVGQRRQGDGYDLPAVVKYKGQYYITDGHHRLMAAAASGLPSIPVRLFDIDGDTQLDFPLFDRIDHSGDIEPGPIADASKVVTNGNADMGSFPELPYTFDLHWDIKTRDKLIEALKHEDADTVKEITHAMIEHEITLTIEEQADIDSWRQYVDNCNTYGM